MGFLPPLLDIEYLGAFLHVAAAAFKAPIPPDGSVVVAAVLVAGCMAAEAAWADCPTVGASGGLEDAGVDRIDFGTEGDSGLGAVLGVGPVIEGPVVPSSVAILMAHVLAFIAILLSVGMIGVSTVVPADCMGSKPGLPVWINLPTVTFLAQSPHIRTIAT